MILYRILPLNKGNIYENGDAAGGLSDIKSSMEPLIKSFFPMEEVSMPGEKGQLRSESGVMYSITVNLDGTAKNKIALIFNQCGGCKEKYHDIVLGNIHFESVNNAFDTDIVLDEGNLLLEAKIHSGISAKIQGINGQNGIHGIPASFTDAYEIAGRIYRNAVLRTVYAIFSNICGHGLPWGILTGIRPTKQLLWMLEAGIDSELISLYYLDNYLCSASKYELAEKVALNEFSILNSDNADGQGSYYSNGYSLYIDIPFCPTTCYYCSFTSYPLEENRKYVGAYLDALKKEIKETSEYLSEASDAETDSSASDGDIYDSVHGKNIAVMRGRHLDTVYIGGGTPTSISAVQLDGLLSWIGKHFDLNGIREYTVEAGRPDTITEEKLLILKKHGVTRISINPQSMNQKTLDLIGRRHKVEDIVDKFMLARSLGFDNINMDIIIGLAEEGISEVKHTLSEIGKLGPDDFTVHSLAVKRAARLNTQKERYGRYKAIDVEKHGWKYGKCGICKAGAFWPL
jgi:hypothetical protein